MEPNETSEPRRHTYLQEEARMLSTLYQAAEVGNDWRAESNCTEGLDGVADWFAPDGTTQAKEATKACFACPVRSSCLEWASRSKQRYGIWGGLPPSLRIQKGGKADKIRPHDYESLVELDNPYNTEDPKNRFHRDNISVWDGEDSDEW